MKDERKIYGAVDKSSSERQFCKLDAITFVVWSHIPSDRGSYGRPADGPDI